MNKTTEEKKKSCRIITRVTEGDYKKIVELAKKFKMPVSKLIRMKVLGK